MSDKQRKQDRLSLKKPDGLEGMTRHFDQGIFALNAGKGSQLLLPDERVLSTSAAERTAGAADSTQDHIAEFYHSIRNAPKPYYDDGKGIVIWHSDCRDVLPTLEAGSVDLVLTDPPYGIAYSSGYGASWENTEIEGDGDTSLRDYVISWARGWHDRKLALPMVVFGTWKVARPIETRAVLIWDKGPAFGMGNLQFPWKNSFEEIYILGHGFRGTRDEGVIKGHIQVSWESKGRGHPNQKPESLLRYLMLKHEGQTVLDPFMGSGPTLRAAKDLGRRAIGIEIEERYCEIAANRLSQEVLVL